MTAQRDVWRVWKHVPRIEDADDLVEWLRDYAELLDNLPSVIPGEDNWLESVEMAYFGQIFGELLNHLQSLRPGYWQAKQVRNAAHLVAKAERWRSELKHYTEAGQASMSKEELQHLDKTISIVEDIRNQRLAVTESD
jgi:hypothetical protein